LGDVHADCPLHDDEVHVFGEKEGLFAIFPLGKGFFRLVADNPPDRFRSERKPTLEEWQEVVNARASVEKQTQRAGRTRGFTAQQKFGPAISEAAEPRAGANAQSGRATPYISLV
jgi:hypothetical protein